MERKRPKQVAVIARRGKTFGGGRTELRRRLREAGYDAPLWYDVAKSSRAKKAIKHAVKRGAELVLVWGGDGLVQHAIDAVVHGEHHVPLAIMPAGTANLLAHNLGVPMSVAGALEAALAGVRQTIDVGVMNGECFAVMAGSGADALTMRGVSKAAKERVGALAYFRSGVRAVHAPPAPMTIDVDGKRWFRGEASCVMFGNVGTIQGGVQLFPRASPTDGKLELTVATARTTVDWARVMARIVTGHPGRSPFLKTTRAERVRVQREAPAPYELDGGNRDPVARLDVRVIARAVTICLPR